MTVDQVNSLVRTLPKKLSCAIAPGQGLLTIKAVLLIGVWLLSNVGIKTVTTAQVTYNQRKQHLPSAGKQLVLLDGCFLPKSLYRTNDGRRTWQVALRQIQNGSKSLVLRECRILGILTRAHEHHCYRPHLFSFAHCFWI